MQRNEENIEHEHHVTDIEQQLKKSYREREREDSQGTVAVQKHYIEESEEIRRLGE